MIDDRAKDARAGIELTMVGHLTLMSGSRWDGIGRGGTDQGVRSCEAAF